MKVVYKDKEYTNRVGCKILFGVDDVEIKPLTQKDEHNLHIFDWEKVSYDDDDELKIEIVYDLFRVIVYSKKRNSTDVFTQPIKIPPKFVQNFNVLRVANGIDPFKGPSGLWL